MKASPVQAWVVSPPWTHRNDHCSLSHPLTIAHKSLSKCGAKIWLASFPRDDHESINKNPAEQNESPLQLFCDPAQLRPSSPFPRLDLLPYPTDSFRAKLHRRPTPAFGRSLQLKTKQKMFFALAGDFLFSCSLCSRSACDGGGGKA